MTTTLREPQTDVSEIEVWNPQDGALIVSVPRVTSADVEAALVKTEVARPVARVASTGARTAILRKVAELIEARKEEFAITIAREGVKTIREARKEVFRCPQTFLLAAEAAHHLTGRTINFDQRPGSENRWHRGFRAPGGIVAPVLSVFFRGPLMSGLPILTWLRFFGWLAIGLGIYTIYSRHHREFAQRIQ
jgi:acyl-CoA reductase-like NAD-dependent aldehyde dehydrogenase